MPKFEIDGISVDAELGTTIIEVVDRMSIPIPRFCYHHKLSVAANCRMCLVHVEKVPKALPACATPVTEGMKVWTKSKDTVAAQRAVMEFLLINHPLDCPICDQGGECELQDLSMLYGRGDSAYAEKKRTVLDQNLGPLIASEMTRCIQCTRCVRFGAEVSGERELGATGRGEVMEIGTFVADTIESEVSGNVIDLCPVGALTSKPFRFKARAWEMQEFSGLSPHDCIGSHLYWHSMREQILRVVPRDCEELNEVWLSDRDRFSYEGFTHADRLRKPLVHKQRWTSMSWAEALRAATDGLKSCIDQFGADQVGVLVSPNASSEELYLLQKLARGMGTNNIDHRLRQLDFSDQELAPRYPNLGIGFRDLIEQDCVILIGCNVAKEQPLASMRLRKMVARGGKVCAINTADYRYNFNTSSKAIVSAADLHYTVAALAKALLDTGKFTVSSQVTSALEDVVVTESAQAMANFLLLAKKKQIILGHVVQMHPQASQIYALANLIANMLDAKCGYFANGANASGAWLTGCVPHRLPNGMPVARDKIGQNAYEMLQTPLKCYVLYGIDPEFDSILALKALQTLKQAEFILAITPYQSDTLLDIADVILPTAMICEQAGSMINLNGSVQQFAAAINPFGESRPGWKILRVLGSMLGLQGCEQNTLDEVTTEMQLVMPHDYALPKWQPQSIHKVTKSKNKDLLRIAPLSLYAVDALSRRAKSLQATPDAHLDAKIYLNSKSAQHLNIVCGETVLVSSTDMVGEDPIRLTVVIDETIANNTAEIYQANSHTLALGPPYCKLEVRKC